MTAVETLLRGLLVPIGLLLPGAGWAFAFRLPLPWFVAGVISVLAVYAGIVGMAWMGVPITALSLSVWLALIALLGGLAWRRSGPVRSVAEPAWREWWLSLPMIPMLFAAAWRALAQPLPGADADFRWDRLAHLLVESGGMAAYPPVSAEQFGAYFWADGIAPLVSGIYAWTYLAAGSMAKNWTAIPVLMQTGAMLALLHALARLWEPVPRAGWMACALAGSVMLLQFSFGLGQETGLTALGAGGLAYYLVLWRRGREFRLLAAAALCAGLAACAREYGALFVLIGAGYVGLTGRNWREFLTYSGLATVWPLLWHLRVWHLTGNPLYAHDLVGLFPVNPVFTSWMQAYVVSYGEVLSQLAGWREITRLLLLSSAPALLGLGVGIFLWWRQPGARVTALLAAAAAAAWVASVPFTAGGLFYSMRVLSPLLLIGCAWGGAALARWIPERRYLAGLLIGLALWGTDASLRALTIPLNPFTIPPGRWLQAGYQLQEDFALMDEPFIVAVAQLVPGRVLSESAGVQHVFLRHGKVLAPLWSPDVRFLFEKNSEGDAAARLIALGYSHVLLTRVQSSVDFLARAGVWQKLDGRLEPVMANGTFILFALKAPAAGHVEHSRAADGP
ncbi:MAG: hypothetical protein QG602_1858 [Verrucomicrobiota bacterium]|nr:hypothetical protein [Verrucomicrobiota bacterium]